MSVKSTRKRSSKEANDDLTNDMELKTVGVENSGQTGSTAGYISIYVEQKNP